MGEPKQKMKTKNFRKRNIEDVVEEDQILRNNGSDGEEEERRLALEEVKFLQKQREKKWGIAAISSSTIVQRSGVGGGGGGGGLVAKKASEKNDGDGEKDELVLQDTFAQETAVMVEDPNILLDLQDSLKLQLRSPFTNGSDYPIDQEYRANDARCKKYLANIEGVDSVLLRYVEQELAKKRGKNVDVANQVENEVKHAEDELYKIPEHLKAQCFFMQEQFPFLSPTLQMPPKDILSLTAHPHMANHLLRYTISSMSKVLAPTEGSNVIKTPLAIQLSTRIVKRRNSEESSTQWTTGIAEVQLPIEFKLKNIEETEAAKKLLQEKRRMGRMKTESSIPASYSADYFQRGRDYAEKLRRDHPELYKERGVEDAGQESRPTDSGTDAAGRRQAATDEFMLERFRKRERHRVMRR
ncbi:hypothetical protein TEA_000497 [Camellia sinensis var. sinensis]|uniref:Uncharacterized protein n=1 Tax=Camellia sinensis var. sinensis TaxID=542762 RepID=A0A4S4DCH0_CAMSN|nr:hypothetical protein TEA_000497 [Camellia sinensis var. sinensis]